jgi:hypothetical protein
MAASMHRLHGVLRRQGLAAKFGMLPRLSLTFNPPAPPAPSTVAATVPGWRPLSGFDHWEGPYPQRGIGRCRWAHGPVARFEVAAAHAGPARLLIACRCFVHGQRIRLTAGGKTIAEREVPVTPDRTPDHIVAVDVELRQGANPIELQSWHWAPGARPMAILVSSISTVVRGASAATEMLAEPKPLAPAAR